MLLKISGYIADASLNSAFDDNLPAAALSTPAFIVEIFYAGKARRAASMQVWEKIPGVYRAKRDPTRVVGYYFLCIES